MNSPHKIRISYYDEVPSPYLFVCSKTGIFFKVQVGGGTCNQAEIEGFLIPLDVRFEDIFKFDDCAWICMIQTGNDEPYALKLRLNLANEIENNLLEKNGRRYLDIVKDIHFDFDRIDELMEGWWPVKFNICSSLHSFPDQQLIPFKGYIHRGNCD